MRALESIYLVVNPPWINISDVYNDILMQKWDLSRVHIDQDKDF